MPDMSLEKAAVSRGFKYICGVKINPLDRDVKEIEISGVFASDGFVRERYFHDFRVTPISDFFENLGISDTNHNTILTICKDGEIIASSKVIFNTSPFNWSNNVPLKFCTV